MSMRTPLYIQFIASTASAISLASLATAQTSYRIIDLLDQARPFGVIQAEVRGVNRSGVCVGFEALIEPEFTARAVVWTRDGNVQFPAALPGDNSTYALAVADDGSILGTSQLVTVEHIGHQIRIHVDDKAVFWPTASSLPIDLNTLVTGGDPLDLRVIVARNAAGKLIGGASPIGGNPFRGFLFDPATGVVTDLATVYHPTGINASNQISGYGGNQDHALLWEAGAVTSLHYNPPWTGVTSRAWGINDAGDIVGEAQFLISQPEQATLWTEGAAIRLIPEFVRPQGVASAINNRGQIAGYYINLDNLNDHWHGFLWQNGHRIDLLEQTDPDEDWLFLFPFTINDRGFLAGGGARNGELGHAWMMIPIPAGDIDRDGDVDLSDLTLLLSAFGTICDPTPCAADLDHDGDVDLSDLTLLLSNFGFGG